MQNKDSKQQIKPLEIRQQIPNSLQKYLKPTVIDTDSDSDVVIISPSKKSSSPKKVKSPPPPKKSSSPKKDNFSFAEWMAKDVDYNNFKPGGSLSYNDINAYIQLLKEQGKKYNKDRDLVLSTEEFKYIMNINKYTPENEVDEIREHTDIKNDHLPEKKRFKIAMNLDSINNIKFNKYDRIFMPAGYGTHWILIIFLPKQKTYFILDPVRRKVNYDDVMYSIGRFLRYQRIKCWKKGIDNTFLPAQRDYVSCGSFMLEALRYYLHEGDLNFVNENVDEIKARMANELKNNKLVTGFKHTKNLPRQHYIDPNEKK